MRCFFSVDNQNGNVKATSRSRWLPAAADERTRKREPPKNGIHSTTRQPPTAAAAVAALLIHAPMDMCMTTIPSRTRLTPTLIINTRSPISPPPLPRRAAPFLGGFGPRPRTWLPSHGTGWREEQSGQDKKLSRPGNTSGGGCAGSGRSWRPFSLTFLQ